MSQSETTEKMKRSEIDEHPLQTCFKVEWCCFLKNSSKKWIYKSFLRSITFYIKRIRDKEALELHLSLHQELAKRNLKLSYSDLDNDVSSFALESGLAKEDVESIGLLY